VVAQTPRCSGTCTTVAAQVLRLVRRETSFATPTWFLSENLAEAAPTPVLSEPKGRRIAGHGSPVS
jgi:hypothetical protein